MWREKMNRLVAAHQNDDRDEALRFRSVSDQERMRLFFDLCRLARAGLAGVPPGQEEPPAAAAAWWKQLFQRERRRQSGGAQPGLDVNLNPTAGSPRSR